MEQARKCVLCRPTADGTLTQQPTVLTLRHPAANGVNAPWYAAAEGVGCGYFKNCANTDRDMEELEVWVAYLGSRLGVNMADTWLVLDENGTKLGSFSLDVTTGHSAYVTAEENKNGWLTSLTPLPRWAVEAAALYAAAPKAEPFPDHRLSVIDDDAALRKLLRFVYGVASCDGRYDVAAAFCGMVLLDCLLWQKDRNMQSFGLVFGPEGQAELSALYDSASVTMPGLAEETVGFCNILTTPQRLRRCAAALFPAESRDFEGRMAEFRRREGDAFDRLQRSFLTESYCRRMERRMAAWLSDPAAGGER